MLNPQPLRWYLTSNAFYLVPGGIQMVMFPYLVAIYLHAAPTMVGVAQMSGQLPMLFLILVGGMLGDRVDQRALLIRLHSVQMAPPLLMAAIIAMGWLSYEFLILWALVGGVLGSFVQPTRDALLNRVAGNDVQRVVMMTTGINFGVQILGFALGSRAEAVGPIPLLCAQALCMGSCAWLTARIPAMPAPSNVRRRHPLREIGEGVAMAWRSPAIRPATVLTFATGIFFAGAFSVVLPLMVRDVYHGGALGIAVSFAANMLGTVATVAVLMRMGGIARPGRALLMASMLGATVLATLHWPIPQWGFYLVTFLWGMCGGVSMTMGRSIVQEIAPDSHRARIMSVYSLGMMGGMPISSVILGRCVEVFGALNAILVSSIGMACVVVYLGCFSELWTIRRREISNVLDSERQGAGSLR